MGPTTEHADRTSLSVDELLERQSDLPVLATIESSGEDRVAVTPVVGGRCACSQTITVSKADIEAVVPTEDVRLCCGKRLIVAEVAFTNETVADIFRQLSQTAAALGQQNRLPYSGLRLLSDRDGLNRNLPGFDNFGDFVDTGGGAGTGGGGINSGTSRAKFCAEQRQSCILNARNLPPEDRQWALEQCEKNYQDCLRSYM
ncbi:hypothetical protein [Mycobacterium sp. 1274761.0]|uniref:hypothetical protein n=1 Tax=Mycobacterium sp. 1274761.0 TaxID=1834077 RepID=UPI00080200F5|nr:hypothetical protein [Mycobacterium sp. 1274761.0]OBK76301.1 hypothetical protein A5651_06760 [Mycobacterium sp. 1274761.0]